MDLVKESVMDGQIVGLTLVDPSIPFSPPFLTRVCVRARLRVILRRIWSALVSGNPTQFDNKFMLIPYQIIDMRYYVFDDAFASF